MKSRAFRAALLLALLAAIGSISFYGGRWWTQRQKQKELSDYIQRTSPITLRMPENATVYVNFYKLRTIYSQVEQTRLSRVLAHWMDTGMKEDPDKPNPVLGGMLEKMLLNVFGEEVGIGISPAKNEGDLDALVVARLAPGSDFLLRLALSQNKKLGRETVGDSTAYSYQTRNPQIPLLYIYVEAEFAYLASGLEILKSALTPGSGPKLLKSGKQESLPENTFLFARCADPAITLIASQSKNRFQFTAHTDALLSGAMPAPVGGSPVIELLTNAPRILKQPSASISLHEENGAPLPALLLAFQDKERAERFRSRQENQYTEEIPPELVEVLETPEMNCVRFPIRTTSRTLCSKDQLFLQTEGTIDPVALLQETGVEAAQKRPLTMRIAFRKEAVAEFAKMIDADDWSRFPTARGFYFLSCIREIRGAIGSGEQALTIEIQ